MADHTGMDSERMFGDTHSPRWDVTTCSTQGCPKEYRCLRKPLNVNLTRKSIQFEGGYNCSSFIEI